VSEVLYIKHLMVGKLVKNYWELCGKKWWWPKFRYYPGILLDRLNKTRNSLVHNSQCSTEIQINHCRTRSQKYYGFRRLAVWCTTEISIFFFSET
jgi:hypothetical protein